MRISNPTFSTEDFEITHIGLFVSEEFISSFLEEFVKIYPVDDMERIINCLNPEATRHLVFIKHSASHFSEGLITHKYRGSQQLSRVEYSTQIY